MPLMHRIAQFYIIHTSLRNLKKSGMDLSIKCTFGARRTGKKRAVNDAMIVDLFKVNRKVSNSE